MKVTWEVEDGYVGKSRPQLTEIPDNELVALSEDERQKLIDEYVQNDFNMNISWDITEYD